MAQELVVVAGGGGFIGSHMVGRLLERGFRVRAVDLKPEDEWCQVHKDVENLELDLRDPSDCKTAVSGANQVFNLAADMGGMGFIENNKALCMLSVLINTHLLDAALHNDVERFFYASSACVYPTYKQTDPDTPGLKESDAYPAMPEDGYGWEKLFSERLCRHFREDFGLTTRIARYHNVYGPWGTWTGGREKAPAAICRKIAEAKVSGTHAIEIWGDGSQTRSFTYIDDCMFGTELIMESSIVDPINLGSSERVTINELVTIVEDIAGITCRRSYDPSAPRGVNGRNSDNEMILARLGWQPSTPLRVGLEKTYSWVYDQVRARLLAP